MQIQLGSLERTQACKLGTSSKGSTYRSEIKRQGILQYKANQHFRCIRILGKYKIKAIDFDSIAFYDD